MWFLSAGTPIPTHGQALAAFFYVRSNSRVYGSHCELVSRGIGECDKVGYNHIGMNRKLWMILGIAAVTAVVVSYALLYPARRYQGDGTIHDSGVVSFPRFRVEFLPMALDEPATRSFRFRRFPGNPASVFIQTPTEPACTLEVSVTNIDPATPSIIVVSTLQGGGIELP